MRIFFFCFAQPLLTHHSDISTANIDLLYSASWIWPRVFNINKYTVRYSALSVFLGVPCCNIQIENIKTYNTEQLITSVLFSQVEAILVNIFGGIVNCAIIANGITKACRELELKVPLVVRLEGRKTSLHAHLLTYTNPDPPSKPVPADTQTIRIMHHLPLNHGTLISV